MLFGKKDTNEFRDPSLAQDLSKLQINTIVKSNISGGNMPAVRFALCDLSTRYAVTLRRFGAEESKISKYIGTGSRKSFTAYASIAEKLKLQMERVEQSEVPDYYMLQRIEQKSNRIVCILDRLQDENDHTRTELSNRLNNHRVEDPLSDLKLDREQYMALQKYWEIGTEQIVMQTVVQLDGDVFTRIQEKYASSDYAALHQLHNNAVNTSYQYWKSLIQIVAQFLNTVFSTLMPKRGK